MSSKLAVLNFIGYGKEEAITRKNLCNKTGLTDRKVREYIEELRNDGYFIVNDSDGIGYYCCNDIERILKYYWAEWRRAISILTRLKKMRAWLVREGIDVTPPKAKKVEEDENEM